MFLANKNIAFKNMDRQEDAKDSANTATNKLSADALGSELCFDLVDYGFRPYAFILGDMCTFEMVASKVIKMDVLGFGTSNLLTSGLIRSLSLIYDMIYS